MLGQEPIVKHRIDVARYLPDAYHGHDCTCGRRLAIPIDMLQAIVEGQGFACSSCGRRIRPRLDSAQDQRRSERMVCTECDKCDAVVHVTLRRANWIRSGKQSYSHRCGGTLRLKDG